MNRSCEDRVTLRLMDLHPNCLKLAVNVFGYAIPVLAICVTTVNILVVKIFMKPHVRSHTTMILSLIACADVISIVCPAVVFVYHYAFGHYKDILTCRQTELAYIFGEICVDTFNMLSLWLTVLLAYIRSRCIKSPFIARRVHSLKRIAIYIFCICILICFVHVPSFFIFDFKSVEFVDSGTNVTYMVCGLLETEGVFFKSCSRRKVHVLMETFMDSIVPCVLLTYYNCIMLFTLREARQSRSSLRRNDSSLNKCQGNGSLALRTEHVESTLHNESMEMSLKKETISEIKKGTHKSCKEEHLASSGCIVVSKTKENNKHIHTSRRKFLLCLDKQRVSEKQKVISTSSDPSLDRLDKESRRTSWVILVVSAIVVVHEIPLVIANTYALASYTNKPLPLSINGCFSVIQILWQFITYPIIFLIYACMSRAFRLELCKSLKISSICKDYQPRPSDKRKSFLSPCLVRKLTSRDEEICAGPSQDKSSENDNVFDIANDSCRDNDFGSSV